VKKSTAAADVVKKVCRRQKMRRQKMRRQRVVCMVAAAAAGISDGGDRVVWLFGCLGVVVWLLVVGHDGGRGNCGGGAGCGLSAAAAEFSGGGVGS
jgi:hypothetical protein